MRLLCCVFVLVVAVVAADVTAQWNNVADAVLRLVTDEQLRRGREEIELRDMEHEFNSRLGFLRVRGLFNATDGWLSDVTTVRRVGDVTSENVGDRVQLTAAVQFDVLRIGYRHYTLKVGKTFEGSVEVRVNNNKVRAVFNFDRVDGECRTSIGDFKIVHLDDVDVKITGLGFLDFLGEQIGKWFIERRKDDIITRLEDFFKSSIPEHLEDFYCDEYASILGVTL